MARKSKEFQRLFREESAPKKRQSNSSNAQSSIRKKELEAFDQFKKKMIESEGGNTKFIDKPKGMKKMSDVLEEFLDPFMSDYDSYQRRRFLLDMGTMAWNLAIFPKQDREEMLKKIASELINPLDPESLEAADEVKDFLETLINEKLEFFSDDRRLIQDYQLTEYETGFHLAVAYKLINE